MEKKLSREFYTRPTLIVAKNLLGKFLVRPIRKSSISNGVKKIVIKKMIGKIVETEAYIGPEDKASHAYQGKITPRNKTEYLEGGHIYIYLCYGIHWQFNVTTAAVGKPECVLIRALEPVEWGNKNQKPKTKNQKFTRHKFCSPATNFKEIWAGRSKFGRASKLKIKNLANGPGKLCRWMKLDKSFDAEDFCKSKRIWLENRGERIKKSQIVATERIGIDYAGEWAKKPWRFYIKDNPFVSKK